MITIMTEISNEERFKKFMNYMFATYDNAEDADKLLDGLSENEKEYVM